MKKKLSFLCLISLLVCFLYAFFFAPKVSEVNNESIVKYQVNNQDTLVDIIKNAKDDYVTETIIELSSDITLDNSKAENITIKSGQNIVFKSKEENIVIGTEHLGYKLNISIPFILDKSSTISFQNDVILTNGGSISAKAVDSETNDFNAAITFSDSLTLEDGSSINSKYFKSFKLLGGLNAYDKNESDISITSDINSPIDFDDKFSIAIMLGDTNFPQVRGKFKGNFGLISNNKNNLYTIDNVGNGYINNDYEMLNTDITTDLTGNYILTNNITLKNNVNVSGNLISYRDLKIDTSGTSFNIIDNNLNLNGFVNNDNKYQTSNKLILDGGANYVEKPYSNTDYIYFINGVDSLGNILRKTYHNIGTTKTYTDYPAIINVRNNSTFNMFNETIIQNNQIDMNNREDDKKPFGNGISLYVDTNDKNLTFNMYGGKIQYNSAFNIKNQIGGAGIGATTGFSSNASELNKALNINIYDGNINYNTLDNKGLYSNKVDEYSGDGAGISINHSAKLTMYNGSVSFNHGAEASAADGAGLMVRAGSIVDIKHGTISYNYTNGYGGGICIWQSTVDILSGDILGNRATFGGGIALSTGSIVNIGDSINSVDIHNNKSEKFQEWENSGYGGGIAVGNNTVKSGLKLTLNNANIYENSAIYGGGISSFTTPINGNQNVIVLKGGDVYNNKAKANNQGNGIYVKLIDESGTNYGHLLEFSGDIRIDTSNNIVFSEVKQNQTPIHVTDKLTTNGIVGLFDVATGDITNTNFVKFTNKVVQGDKFLLDSKNYYLESSNGNLVVKQHTGDVYVAEINGVKYKTLKEAVDTSKNNDVIYILSNISLTENDLITVINKKITIKSKDNNLYSLALSKDFNAPTDRLDTGIMVIGKGADLTLENIIIDGNSAISNGYSFIYNAGSFTLGESARLVNNLSNYNGGAISSISGDSGSITHIRGHIIGNKGPNGAIDIQGKSTVNIYSTAVIEDNYSSKYDLNVGVNLQSDARLNIYGSPKIKDIIYHQGGIITIYKDNGEQYLKDNLNIYLDKNYYKAKYNVVTIDNNAIDGTHTLDYYSNIVKLANKEHKGDSFVGFKDANANKNYIMLDRVIMVKLKFDRLYNQDLVDYVDTPFDISKINTVEKLKVLKKELGLKEDLTLHGNDLVVYMHSNEKIMLEIILKYVVKPGYKLESYLDLNSKQISNSSSTIEYTPNDSDILLAAIWKEITYKFEFYENDKSVSKVEFEYKFETGFVNVSQDKTQLLPLNEFFKVGYYFSYWQLGNETFYDGYEINKNFVLKYGSSKDNVIRLYGVFTSMFDKTSGDGSVNSPFVLTTKDHIKYLAYTVNGYGNDGLVGSPLTFELGNGRTSTYYNNKGSYTAFNYKNYYFILGADISGVDTTIGRLAEGLDITDIINNTLRIKDSISFNGSFDGKNHTITLNFNNSYDKSGVALFAYTNDANITNLIVDGIVTGNNFVAGIISLAISGRYENLTNRANVSGSGYNIGGVFSTIYTPESNMNNSYVRTVINNGQIKYQGGTNSSKDLTNELCETPNNWNESKYFESYAGSRVGGIIGHAINVNLDKAYNTGQITGRMAVGGIVGALAASQENKSSLLNVNEAYNNGDVLATSGVLFAYTYTSNRLHNSKETLDVVSAYVGGIVGRMYGSGTIINAGNDGKVTASYVGKRIEGSNTDGWTYKYEYVTDINNVTKGEYIGARGAGGILGISSFSKESGIVHGGNKEIKYVYNTGNIKAFTAVGGIAGFLAYSTIDYAISGGFLTATGFSFNENGEKVSGGSVYNAVNGKVRRNYVGGIVGFSINTTLYNNAIFNADIESKGVTDSVIKAIGDSDMSLIGFEENNNNASKLSSKELFVGEGNKKPTGLKPTFLDQGWSYLNYKDSFFYYPQLSAFANNPLKIDGEITLSIYSKNSVQMVYSENGGEEKPLEPTKNVTFSYDLNGGSVVTGGSSQVEVLPNGNYVYRDITYINSNGSLISSIQFGTTSITPLGANQLNKDGYTFGGWYRDKSFSEKYDFNNISAVNITLYAKWDIIEYKINYVGINSYADGQVSLIGDYKKVYVIEEKDKLIELPTKDNFRSGNNSYEFVGFKYVLSDKFYDVDSFKINEENKVELYYKGVKVDLPTSHIIELSDLEFKLEAKPIEFKLNYELNGGENNSSNPNSYTIRDQVDLKNPSKKGHKFLGWYTTSNFDEKTKIDLITRGSVGNKTLYAKFERLSYELAIDKKNGSYEGVDLSFTFEGNRYTLVKLDSGLYAVKVPYGTNLQEFIKSLPKPKSYEGYTFVNWSSNTDINQDIVGTMPNKRLVIFAYHEVSKYTITINSNQYASYNIDQEFLNKYEHYECQQSPDGQNIVIIVPYGSDISNFLNDLRVKTVFTQGYHFNGFISEGFNYHNVKGPNTNLEINISTDKDLFSWDIYDKDFVFITSIKNNTEGFTGSFSSEFLKNYLETNFQVVFNKPGFIYKGFSFSKNGPILSLEQYIISEHKTLFVKYDSKEFNIIFDTLNGNTIDSKYTVKYEETFGNLPDASKVGYKFVGWLYNDKLINSNTIFTIDDPDNKQDITLVAKYELIEYNIRYENLKGQTPIITKFTIESGIVNLGRLSNVYGYNFKGYRFIETSDIIHEFDPKAHPHDVYLEALWEEKSFEITFDANGGYYEWNSEDAKYGTFYNNDIEVTQAGKANKYVVTVYYKGQLHQPRAPKKVGHTFSSYNGDLSTEVISNRVVSALYNTLKYEVLFDTDGGSEIPRQEVEYNGKIVTNNPVKKGYTFSHWEYNSRIFEIDKETVTTDLVLKAIYTTNKYDLKITIEYSGIHDLSSIKNSITTILNGKFVGNVLSVKVDFNKNLEALNNIINTNNNIYIVGYFKDNTQYTFTTMPIVESGELSVALRITDEKPYEVKGEYIELGQTKHVTLYFVKQHSGKYKLLNLPLNIFGYKFGGWYTSNDFLESNRVNFDIEYDQLDAENFSKKTIYAKLTPDTYKIEITIKDRVESLIYTYGMSKAEISEYIKSNTNLIIVGTTFDKFVYTASNVDFITSLDDGNKIISGDLALTANFIDVIYKIRWHYGNNLTLDVSYILGDKIEVFKYNKEYYQIVWYLGNDLNNFFKEFDIAKMPNMVDLNTILDKEHIVTQEGDSLILNIYAKETPITYTIEFNLDGGVFANKNNKVKFDAESKNIVLGTPTKKYEEFSAFLFNDKPIEMKLSYTFSDLIKYFSNPNQQYTITLTASYIPNVYRLSFNNSFVDFTYKDTVVSIKNFDRPNKFGYIFKGFKFNNDNTLYLEYIDIKALLREIDSLDGSGNEIKLVAEFDEIVYEILIIDENGAVVNPLSYSFKYSDKDKSLLDLLKENNYSITKPGHYFNNSFATKNFNTVTINSTLSDLITYANITNVIALKPIFEVYKYNISLTNDDVTKVIEATYGLTTKLPSSSMFSIKGYKFMHWINKNTGETYKDESQVINIITPNSHNETVSLHAVYEAITYTIRFSGNGATEGVQNEQLFTYDKSEKLNSNNYKKLGYIFEGWSYKNQIFNDQSDILNITDKDNEVLIFRAKWQAISYRVDFYDGINKLGSLTLLYDQNRQLPSWGISKEGYNFVGWSKKAGSLNLDYNPNDSIINLTTKNDDVINLYVVWEIRILNVTIHVRDTVVSQQVTYGEKLRSLEAPIIDGYEFIGWYLSLTGNDKFNVNDVVVNDMHIYARYNRKTYTITYLNYESSLRPLKTTYTFGDEFLFETPIKEGYSFKGWYLSDNQNVEIKGIKATDFGDKTIIALWTINPYVINIEISNVLKENIDSIVSFITKALQDRKYNNVIVSSSTNLTSGTIKIKFNANYNTDLSFLNTIFDANYRTISKVDGIDNRIKTTYELSGYYNENHTKFEFGLVNKPLMIYAQYKEVSTTLVYTYNFKGYAYKQYLEVLINDNGKYKVDTLPTYKVDGYIFSSWKLNNGNNFDFNKEYESLEEIILTYSPIKYQIKFDKNSSKATGEMLNQEFTFDVIGTHLNRVLYNNIGHKFVGWSINNDGNVDYLDEAIINNLTTNNGEVITLYAVWAKNKYQITFDTNGATELDSIEVYYDDLILKHLNELKFSKYGYKFIEFRLNGIKITEDTKMEAKNIVVELVFEAISYKIKFDPNFKTDTIMEDLVVKYDETKKLSLNQYVRDGYTFIGWGKDKDSRFRDYQDGEEIHNLTGDATTITLYALWTEKTYDGRIVIDGLQDYSYVKAHVINYLNYRLITDVKVDVVGNELVITFKALYNTDLGFLNSLLDGYTIIIRNGKEYKFKGFDSKFTTMKLDGIDVKASYEIKKYTLNFKFDIKGNIVSLDHIVESNSLFDLSTIKLPEVLGYKFDGFYDNNNYSGPKLETIIKVLDNYTLYAKYDPIKYNVNYIFDNKVLKIETFTYDNEYSISKIDYVKKGHTFIGYEYNGKIYSINEVVKNLFNVEANIKLIAKYEVNTYKVSFDTDGGSYIDSLIVRYGDSVILTTPTKVGYNFVGWYLDDKLINDINSYEFEHDIILKARFEITKYKVTFKDGNNICKELYVNHGLSIGNLTLESSNNRLFVGWTLDGELFDITTLITKDLTLEAKWKVLNLEHKLDDNITISIKSNNGFDEGSKIKFNIVTNELDLTKVSEVISDLGRLVVLYDIDLVDKDGNSITLDEYVTITIKAPTKKYYELYKVFYISDNYDSFKDLVISEDNGNIIFSTNHFSYYGVALYDGPNNFSWVWILIITTVTFGFSVAIIVLVKNKKYTIKFITNSEKEIKKLRHTPDEIIYLPTPHKEGYDFDGWYYDSNFMKPALLSVMPRTSLVLFAKWVESEVIIDHSNEVKNEIIITNHNDEFYIPVPEDDELVEVKVYELYDGKNTIESKTNNEVNVHFNDYSIDMEQLIKDTDDTRS